jgi:hypothetical protein
METRLFRVIYAVEFLAALIAALEFWNYVGGPAHLDYVPWYWKGIMSIAVAVCAVKLTVSDSRPAMVKWLIALALLVAGCGLLSYYAHLNEPQDQGDEQDQVVPTLYRHSSRPI